MPSINVPDGTVIVGLSLKADAASGAIGAPEFTSEIVTRLPVAFFTRRVVHGGFQSNGCATAEIVPRTMRATTAKSERQIFLFMG
jgi:hypothetical protein